MHHPQDLPESKYDSPLGSGTGAAVIFGATGGVMEAALRTAYELVTGASLPRIDLNEVRGLQGIKSATIPMIPKGGDKPVNVRVAVASGIANAKKLLAKMKSGEVGWSRPGAARMPPCPVANSCPAPLQEMFDFVEVMACPGGCIGGGGQPKTDDPAALAKRMNALYSLDQRSVLRKSHENPEVQAIYRDFLVQPNAGISHDLLHTSYFDRSKEIVPQEPSKNSA